MPIVTIPQGEIITYILTWTGRPEGRTATMPAVRNNRAKHWCFTLNNYTDEDVQRLQGLGDQVDYLVVGREVGESGTRHLQGCVSFRERKRFTQAKSVIGVTAHIEVCRLLDEGREYCKKDGDFFEVGTPSSGAGARTDLDAFKDDVKSGNLDFASIREIHSEVYAKYTRFCIEYVEDHLPKKVVEAHELRPWQEALVAKLEQDPDDRTVTFIVDTEGNQGKTWFAHWYHSTHENVQVLLPGKKADMTYVLDCTATTFFVDAPRSKQGEYLQYDFLEEVKNGYIFSGKYESRIKHLGRVHLVVLMNEMPDLTKLSADRYDIVEI